MRCLLFVGIALAALLIGMVLAAFICWMPIRTDNHSQVIHPTLPVMAVDVIDPTLPVRTEDTIDPTLPVRTEDVIDRTMPVRTEDTIDPALPVRTEDVIGPILTVRTEFGINSTLSIKACGELKFLLKGLSIQSLPDIFVAFHTNVSVIFSSARVYTYPATLDYDELSDETTKMFLHLEDLGIVITVNIYGKSQTHTFSDNGGV